MITLLNYMIAASAPEAQSLRNWILSAVLLLTLFFLIKKLTAKPDIHRTVEGPIHVKSQGPVEVKLEDQFITRREYDDNKLSTNENLAKLEVLQQQVLDKIDQRDQRLTELIDRYSSSGYKGRLRLHEEHKNLRDRITRAETILEVQNDD